MQIDSKQIEKLVKEIERLNKPSIKLVDSPKREIRKVDNLLSMQAWAMEELWKALEINKNKR
tara:strand:- start:5406 stop:5591 length:186 start_codon:yes stop_codon:yes gene_type:complete